MVGGIREMDLDSGDGGGDGSEQFARRDCGAFIVEKDGDLVVGGRE